MSQFSVYPNSNRDTRARIPWLLDVQNSLLNDLTTRLVIPLCHAAAMKGAIIHQLMPVLNIKGKDCVLLTPQMAGIPDEHTSELQSLMRISYAAFCLKQKHQ